MITIDISLIPMAGSSQPFQCCIPKFKGALDHIENIEKMRGAWGQGYCQSTYT